MKRPTINDVRKEIEALRAFIDDADNDPLERRIAQVAEDALRWATEATDWRPPSQDLKMADIIRREFQCYKGGE